jgi:hypothetical protein
MPVSRRTASEAAPGSRAAPNRSSTAACSRSAASNIPLTRPGPCTTAPAVRSATRLRCASTAALSSAGSNTRPSNCRRTNAAAGAGSRAAARPLSSR